MTDQRPSKVSAKRSKLT